MTMHTPLVDTQIDEWHQHSAAEGAPQPAHADRANPFVLVGVWAAITGSVITIVVVVAIFFSYSSTVVRQQRIETTALSAEHQAYRDQSLAARGQSAWVDSDAGVVKLPVDIAIEKVVSEYNGE